LSSWVCPAYVTASLTVVGDIKIHVVRLCASKGPVLPLVGLCRSLGGMLTAGRGAGLLAGVAARAQRPEYAQLLADCQRAYCDTRLSLVTGVVAERVVDYAREPLPTLTRNGCSYLMQVSRSPRGGLFEVVLEPIASVATPCQMSAAVHSPASLMSEGWHS
jgi:hypothetical protein